MVVVIVAAVVVVALSLLHCFKIFSSREKEEAKGVKVVLGENGGEKCKTLKEEEQDARFLPPQKTTRKRRRRSTTREEKRRGTNLRIIL